MLKLRFLWFMIHYPVPRMLHLVDIRAIPVLIECECDLHSTGDAVVELRPLQDVLARVVLELDLHVRLGHGRETRLVYLRDSEGLSWEGLHGAELQGATAYRLG